MNDPELGTVADESSIPHERGVLPSLARAGSHAAAVLLVFAMVVIVVNSLFRRFLGGGSHLVTELAGYTFMVLTYLGAAGAMLLGRHVAVELLTNSVPERLRFWVTDIALGILGCVFVALLFWATLQTTLHSYSIGQVNDGTIRFLLWPILAIVPLGSLLLLAACIYLVWKSLLTLKGGDRS